MIYVLYKDTDYQDFENKRVDVGLYHVEEKIITNPKDIALFGSECCKEFLEKDVFFDDKVGAYSECARRNLEIIRSFLLKVQKK